MAEACTEAHKASGLQQGGKFATIQLDVADKAQIASFIDKIPQELRAIDILGMTFADFLGWGGLRSNVINMQ